MKDNLHDNDIHLRASFDVGFASGGAEIFIDRTPRGAGPDARCARLVALVSLGALAGVARGISIIPRAIRVVRAGLRSDEALQAVLVTMANSARTIVSAEIDDILAHTGVSQKSEGA